MNTIEHETPELGCLLEHIGSFIKLRRKELSLTQQDVADKAMLDRCFLSAIENGKTNVGIAVLCRIALALDSSVERMVAGSDFPELEQCSDTSELFLDCSGV